MGRKCWLSLLIWRCQHPTRFAACPVKAKVSQNAQQDELQLDYARQFVAMGRRAGTERQEMFKTTKKICKIRMYRIPTFAMILSIARVCLLVQ